MQDLNVYDILKRVTVKFNACSKKKFNMGIKSLENKNKLVINK